MITIRARNVNHAYVRGAKLLLANSVRQPTRDGEALVCKEPVTTRYENPQERVLFSPKRDANPFFHLMEALWILAGRNDVAWLAQFLPRIKDFSDDGTTFHGAYGHRLRHWEVPNPTAWEFRDQLSEAIRLLRREPTTRRCVLSIWDPARDLDATSRDIPCNDTIKLDIREGKLCMIVFNRSNDMIWGAYGANAVQFSVLQEYVAAMVGASVGWYEQVSSDFHAYLRTWTKHEPFLDEVDTRYEDGRTRPFRLVHDPAWFDSDLKQFMEHTEPGKEPLNLRVIDWDNVFFKLVAGPMYLSYMMWRDGQHEDAYRTLLTESEPCDWVTAGLEWMERRMEKQQEQEVPA